MPESDAMPPEETSVKSLLDKPLDQLTEDDIAQVTREDCRRYLKEKGMRRPSWNKSQAIQQVIMLKKLLETTPNFASGSQKRLRISESNYSIPESVSWAEAENSVLAGEITPYHRKDMDKPDSLAGFGRFVATAFDESSSQRNPGLSHISEGQMAIFYCGKVNVYDDVPADKAQAIMHVAASPMETSQEQHVSGSMPLQPLSRLSKAVTTKEQPNSVAFLLPLRTEKMCGNPRVLGEESNMLHEGTPAVEGSSTRKVSVQRYLEKRKDRFKSKRRAGLTSFGSMDVYFNHQIDNQMPRRSNTCSPPTLVRPPSTPTCFSSVDESLKKVHPHGARNNNDL